MRYNIKEKELTELKRNTCNEMIYDIVIIGAGPAGSMFARQAAGKYKKILLVDAQDENHQKPCGGLLSPDAQKVLARLNLALPKKILSDPQTFSVKTIDVCTKRITNYQRLYLNMNRRAFDRWLLSLIPQNIEILRGRCLNAERRKSEIDGKKFKLTIKASGRTRIVYAKQIIGADGAGSMIRRAFFSSQPMHYMAIQQWFDVPKGFKFYYSCIFDRQTSDSCSWIIRKGDKFIFGGCFKPQNCRDLYESQKKRVSKLLNISLETPLKVEACLALRPRKMSDFQMASDGAYLIGEAAGFISASSFEGISYAIESAVMLAKAFNKSDNDENLPRIYRKLSFNMRLKLLLKIKKRWFLYTPVIRKLIMKMGLKNIGIQA